LPRYRGGLERRQEVKKAFALCAIVLVIALSIVPCFAAPTSLPPGVELGGALSMSATISMANGVAAQMAFLNSSGYIYAGSYYAAFITARDLGGDQWMYRVYLLPNSAGLSHYGSETGWLQPGASLIVTPSPNSYYYTDYNFSASGGMGSWTYGYAAEGVGLKLAANEQIVYCFKLANGQTYGVNRHFSFGSVENVPAARAWINALQAFDGDLSWERVEEDVENAYASGKLAGFNQGKAEAEEAADEYWSERLLEAEELAYQRGEDDGYDKAVDDLANGVIGAYDLDLGKIITAIPTAAKAIVNNAFGFELFGINVAGLLSVVLIISIVGFIVAKLSSR
jgi:hypothetical protein